MDIICVNEKNIEKEHICCAISDKKGDTCVASKKAWMSDRFKDGLTFRRLDARGKVFIEYIPAEYAWYPICAEGYMHIDCFWVSGKYKGQGYANQLLDHCISDARKQGKAGVTVLSSNKKMAFLSDPKYLKYRGFQLADTAAPYYELLYLPFEQEAPVPGFKDCAKEGKIPDSGLVLYYSNQCPHTDKYAPVLQDTAKARGVALEVRKLETTEAAQNAPCPFTTYSLFYNGEFVTNEILSAKKFEKFMDEKGL